MGLFSKVSTLGTPGSSEDEDNASVFTDGDFDESGEENDGVTRSEEMATAQIPVNETANVNIKNLEPRSNGVDHAEINGSGNDLVHTNGVLSTSKTELSSRDSSNGDQNTTIVDFIGKEHSHAEQRLAARRAARAEAREIRMRELERQQREQEDHADKAYDMYTETIGGGGRRAGPAGAGRAPLHSPRRSSDTSDTLDDTFSLKDLRHELKEVEEKFRKAMILNAQLDNDKAALSYQLELLKDRIEDLEEQHAQLQREHKEKCSAHERLRREHTALQEELAQARNAIRARDAAIAAAGYTLVEATLESAPELVSAASAANGAHNGYGDVPALALVSAQSHEMLQEGEGTLDVRLQNLFSSKQQLESEVRRLKLQLNEEQDKAGRHNGTSQYDDYDEEMETVRRNCAEYKSRAARAETEAAVLGASVVRLEAQVVRLRARQDDRDAEEEQLKQDRRRLQREAREAQNRVEELETENSHLTKRLDKLKNAKSALLKEL